MAFRKEFLKGTFEVRFVGCMIFLGLVGDEVNRVIFQESQLSASGVWSLESTNLWSVCSLHPPPWGGSYIPQNNSKICIRLLGRSLEEELGICLIPERFKLSCLTAFPLFLHSITSLISNHLSLHFGT